MTLGLKTVELFKSRMDKKPGVGFKNAVNHTWFSSGTQIPASKAKELFGELLVASSLTFGFFPMMAENSSPYTTKLAFREAAMVTLASEPAGRSVVFTKGWSRVLLKGRGSKKVSRDGICTVRLDCPKTKVDKAK